VTSNSICAVHGLNGNAFDTWMADNGRVWLHDFLPNDPPFDRSRIMTFGYESTLVDTRKLTDRFEDYADQLIREIIRVRGSNPTRKRPIIFICHSMGGLVARLAMTRMHSLPDKFKGLSLEKCGILFLSTPHLGSLQADRSPFIVALGEGLVGLRTGVVKELQSFNASSVDNTDMFQAMKVKPVFQCFCESEPTRVLAKDRLVRHLMLSKNFNNSVIGCYSNLSWISESECREDNGYRSSYSL
jgi:triacylglycerol esterase/lipase EstA (alpha/beta hydrolase family)